MKIGIDVRLSFPSLSGVGRYAFELLKHLATQYRNHEFYAFSNRRSLPETKSIFHALEIKDSTGPGMKVIPWEQIVLPLKAKMNHIDLYHNTTTSACPPLLSIPVVVTVHDLAWWKWPDLVTQPVLNYLRYFFPGIIKRASVIIAVSEATRQDLFQYIGNDDKRVHVVPEGIDERFKPASNEEVERFRQNTGIAEPYILFVGSVEPRKDIPTLVRAFEIAAERNKDIILVLAGGKGWLNHEADERIMSSAVRDRIRRLGYIDDGDLPAIYSGAEVFIMPSRYEGFGLPVLEAMACGCPVVSSDAGSLPEVVGDAGMLFPSADSDACAEGISLLLGNTVRRTGYIHKGLERANLFSWTKSADLTFQIYDQILKGE